MKRALGGSLAFVFFLPILLLVVIGGGGCAPAVASGEAVSVDVDAVVDQELQGLSGDPQVRADQLRNAALIMNAAQALSLPVKAQAIGVMTAMGESSLINVDYGDDRHGVTNPDGTPTCSLGLFQQQWCLGWGTREQVMDPTYAATKFYERLVAVEGWQDLAPTIAAHRVQRNADPFHYEKYWTDANAIVAALTGLEIDPTGESPSSCAVDTAAGSGDYPTDGGPGAWGGHSNGRIPGSAMKVLPWASGHYLRADATDALTALNNVYQAQFGRPLSITDAYRDYDTQVRLKAQKGGMAATPGTSNHGWGLAVDLGGGINRFGTPQHLWMKQNAPAYGWILPSWADQGGVNPEPWHWEYWGVADAA
ncbi:MULTISPECIES: M15 family metallopeptidase [Cellulosimicrobium]|uniref:M15 family metallopeptidase n=1 Tax=Cellulosimicrobium TaxID=157920 RepID=UPI001FD1D408|nr:M15 family metallopeptidase [Cellulosimicrobium cellulans]